MLSGPCLMKKRENCERQPSCCQLQEEQNQLISFSSMIFPWKSIFLFVWLVWGFFSVFCSEFFVFLYNIVVSLQLFGIMMAGLLLALVCKFMI